jgi:hypothetical protein
MAISIAWEYNWGMQSRVFMNARELKKWRKNNPCADILYVADDRKRLKNVGAVPDWLDIMAAGTVEFDLDQIDELRMNSDD